MAFADEISGQVDAVEPTVWTWDDGTDDSLWDTRRVQSQALYTIRDGAGQLTWSVLLHRKFFEAISAESVEDVRAGLLDLVAHAVVWADQMDART